MSSNQPKSKGFDLVSRGIHKPDFIGTVTFVGLRLLDIYIQYRILADDVAVPLLGKVGLKTLEAGLPTQTGIGFIDALGLSPYRLLLLTMSTGSSLKQAFWVVYINKESFKFRAAATVAVMNSFYNCVNNIAGTTSLFSGSTSSPSLSLGLLGYQSLPVIVGSVLYFFGIFTEAISESQRKWFKDDPRNAGKCYTGGLWSIARHINYTGYAAWRGGYAMASAGWIWGFGVGGLLGADFNARAIPILDDYCTKRYGEQWAEFKRKTPYTIIPGIW